jgi:hypothetical protein
VGFNESVVHFSQLVVLGIREVKVRWQTNVVGTYPCEFFDLGHSLYVVDFWDGNLLLFVRGDGFGIIRGDDDESVLVGVDFIELFFCCDELEGF